MKIASIQLFHLSAKLPDPIGNALVIFDKRETLLVRITDQAGLSGWGETWSAPLPAATLIETRLAPRLIGQDPQQVGRLWHMLCGLFGAHRHGLPMMAIAAVDMALHDLAARQRGVPVSALLGGAQRDQILAYASGPYFKPGGHPYREFQKDMDSYLRAGFRAVKLRSGFSPREDGAIALAMRAQMGPDLGLMVDFNQSYTPRASIEAANRMQEAGLLWMEEPAVPADVAGYQLVSRQVVPALAGGEALTTAADFLPFLAAGCLDILQPDIALCGGLEGVRRVAALAEMHDRPLLAHVWGSTVNFHAALQLSATLPSVRGGGPAPYPFLEYDAGPNPLRDLAGRPALNADGTLTIPNAPGLGFDLTPEQLAPFVASHRVIEN
jgi:D-galactarolactone cycloisomerase